MPEPPTTRERLLDAALAVLGERGAGAFTVRAVEALAELPHGSVRHHFGDRRGLLAALPEHLALREAGRERPLPALLGQWLGDGRAVTLARYELFLLAARDPELRERVVAVRDRLVARLTPLAGADRAGALLAEIDGLVLDALLRGDPSSPALEREAQRLAGG